MLIHLLASKWIQLLDPLLALTGRSGVERRRLTVPAVCRNATDLPLFCESRFFFMMRSKKTKNKRVIKTEKSQIGFDIESRNSFRYRKKHGWTFFRQVFNFLSKSWQSGPSFFFLLFSSKKDSVFADLKLIEVYFFKARWTDVDVVYIFCSTSLPLASTRWVWLTLLSLCCPLF